MKASITFYPNALKKSKQTGKIPLYARVYCNALKAEERLNAEVTENDLVKWDPMSMRFSDRTLMVNKPLNTLDSRFEEFVILQSTSLPSTTPRKILDYCLGKEETKKVQLLLLDYVDRYLNSAVLHNPDLTPGTIRNYKKAINHFKNFLAKKGKEEIQLEGFNHTLALEFKDYLQCNKPDEEKKGMSEVSASSIVKNLKPIFNRAVHEGHLKVNPLMILKLRHKSARRDRLTIGHVKALYNLDLKHSPSLQAYLDIFLFSVFTGLAYQDAISLRPSDLEKRENGSIKLSIRRGKTGILTESLLVAPAITIIERNQDTPENQITGRTLPKRSNEKLNVNLKTLAGMAGIPINLSSHIARHTHRQLLAEAGIEDRGVIKRMMGHSGTGDIDSVYYSVTESRLLSAKNRFEDYLMQHLNAG